jgi:hypothetical protein
MKPWPRRDNRSAAANYSSRKDAAFLSAPAEGAAFDLMEMGLPEDLDLPALAGW